MCAGSEPRVFRTRRVMASSFSDIARLEESTTEWIGSAEALLPGRERGRKDR